MDRLIATITVIGTFFAGVFGNIVAHDFCQFTPKLCRKLIKRATSSLSHDADKARYQEEWMAHLAECTGTIEQYRHAISVVRGARRLRKERKIVLPINFTTATLQFEGIGSVTFNYPTGVALMNLVDKSSNAFGTFFKYSPNKLKLILFLRVFIYALRAGKEFGRVDIKCVIDFLGFSVEALKTKNSNIKLSIDRVTLDLKKLAKFVSKHPNGIAATIDEAIKVCCTDALERSADRT
jgi:hypothetical protein